MSLEVEYAPPVLPPPDLRAAAIPAFRPSRYSVLPIGVIGGIGQIGTMERSPLSVFQPSSKPTQKSLFCCPEATEQGMNVSANSNATRRIAPPRLGPANAGDNLRRRSAAEPPSGSSPCWAARSQRLPRQPRI